MLTTRVIITGSRDWRCEELAARVVARLVARYGPDLVLVHGAAPGVDAAFDLAAIRAGVARDPHPADWRTHGDAAGPLRNQAMVDRGAAFCIAVHSCLPRGKGTRDCVRRCLAAGIPVWAFATDDQVEPQRIRELPGRA